MSLFSENIIEDPWINMAYRFWNCTHPAFQSDVWNAAFKINWSKPKLKNFVKGINRGTIKFSESDFDEMKEILRQHGIEFIDKEYYYIIVSILISPTLDSDNLSQILTNCLSDKKLSEGGFVQVKIKFQESDLVYLIIHTKTTTPQRIEITLKRR